MNIKSKKQAIDLVKTRDELAEKIKEVSVNLAFDDELEVYIDHLYDFFKVNKDLNIPIRAKTDDNLSIGKFVHTKLRPRFRKWKSLDKINNMNTFWSVVFDFSSKEVKYFKELEKMGFSSNLRDASNDWEDGYKELEHFFQDNKHTYVKPGTKYGVKQYPLGTWVSYQRVQRKNNKLDHGKINRLNRLNFLWIVDLGSIFLDANTSDPMLVDTKLNLKKTFDLPIDRNEANLLQKFEKEQEKLTKISIELEKAKLHRVNMTYELNELNQAIKQLDSKKSSYKHTSIDKDLDSKIQFEVDKLAKLSQSIDSKHNVVDQSIKSLQDSINFLEHKQSSLTSSLNDMRSALGKPYKKWSDWNKIRKIRSYKDAHNYVKNLGINSVKEWRALVKSNQLPHDIPSSPNIFYKNEWTGWGDFLGYGDTVRKNDK